MITKHLHSFLTEKNIPFVSVGFGVSILREYYDYNIFKSLESLNISFLDSTFIINYPN